MGLCGQTQTCEGSKSAQLAKVCPGLQRSQWGLVCLVMGKYLSSLCGDSVDAFFFKSHPQARTVNQPRVYFGECSI